MTGEPRLIEFRRPVDSEFAPHLAHKVKQRRRDYSQKQCKHITIEVDKDARRVFCGACNVELDPIQCLIDIAYHEQRTDERIEEIRKYNEQQKLAANAKREQKKASAQKRLKKLRAGEPIVIENVDQDGRWSSQFGIFKSIEGEHVMLECPGFKPFKVRVDQVCGLQIKRTS